MRIGETTPETISLCRVHAVMFCVELSAICWQGLRKHVGISDHEKSETVTNRNVPEIEKSYERLMGRFRRWAETRFDIRTAVVVGSRARVDHPADEWADLDVVIVTRDPEHYVSTSDWIDSFGKPLLTFVEPTSVGDDKERRVLYEGMLDVDFAIISQERAQGLFQARADPRALAQISNLLGRGVRVLVDKDGMASQLNALAASVKKPRFRRPTQNEFLEVVNDFFYHAVFTAKHLRRGELWWTVTCLDCHMQHSLLRMIEWHALATHDWKHDTWFRGRFLEEWAHPKAIEELHEAFAHCDKKDIKRALLATVDLFRWLAIETATKLDYSYPARADEDVTKWIEICVSEARSKNR
jgi:aminoglycoside 6-adenylyltransferase